MPFLNYTTYKKYYQLVKSIRDKTEVDKKKAATSPCPVHELTPHNIAQKSEVMVEHFRHFTKHKICGQAKAMVVTSGRYQAVRYNLHSRQHITC